MIKDFFKPSSIAEALEMKDKNPGAFFLGGGTKLNKGGENFNAAAYISLEHLGLDSIELENNALKIGAMVTLQKLMDSEDVPQFLKDCAAGESNRNLRNASTVGGEIGYCMSSSNFVAGLLAMEAEVETDGKGKKTLEEYISGNRDDLITAVILPSSKAVLMQKDQRSTANSKPELTVTASVLKEGGKVAKAVVVIGGVAEKPMRLKKVEARLVDGSLASADAVQDAVQDELVPYTEKRERGTYLNYIGAVLTADCVGKAMR
ncbi:FAD binding domain-containing protein [Spirochaeta isovalerica]|uniref:Putative selenate reductase FAD-binding subunit n=1 Tax=Spirochaeta isovalerica TaxID=150 RepID=A0A841R975_9SPIO|nr:FAD binding domain-containing protein [Spirochaeta isovalerica]MBB6479499.1 putative selenate reductase FAD-binding subunit [Spirochaeta isovalerica]